MLIKKPDDIKGDEITGKNLYLGRRTFMRGVVLAGSTLATGLVYRRFTKHGGESKSGEKIEDLKTAPPIASLPPEETRTPYQDITHYNNFYEFSTDKQE